ncbi:MAG: hypothetical protein WCB92_35515 [Mycobacterium sp.]
MPPHTTRLHILTHSDVAIPIPSAVQQTLRLEIYVSDGHAEHYLMVNADGTVRPDF